MEYQQLDLTGKPQGLPNQLTTVRRTLSHPPKRPPHSIALKELPTSEWPVNRIHQYSGTSLSTTELLAILLGHQHQLESAALLLATYENLTGLARASNHDLQSQPGVGHTTTARIKAALELGRRLTMDRQDNDRPQIRSPADAANLLLSDMSLLEREELRVLLLDTKNRVQKIDTVYVGSLNTQMIRVGEVFRNAIRDLAAAIVVAHNHPSGDPTPSPEDVAVTKQIVEAGKLLDVDVLDHIIIGTNRWVSLKERGLGF